MPGRWMRMAQLLAVIGGVILVACGSSGGGGTSNRVHIPKTGQTVSYDANAVQADDGALQAGQAWPSPRFSDNGSGTMTDRLTGLVWSKDANVMVSRDPTFDGDATAGDGYVTWQHARDYVTKLNAEAYLGHSDWRLPNIRELRSLSNYGAADLSVWLDGLGFSNVDAYAHWSSTASQAHPDQAWFFWLWSGHISCVSKTLVNINYGKVWPVRGRSNLPRTGQTDCWDAAGASIGCAGSGLDGELQLGVEPPTPRFQADGAGAVNDRFTALVWPAALDFAATVDCPAPATPKPTWQEGLDHVACLNAHAYLGRTDWREANVNELESLFDYGVADRDAWFTSSGFDAAPGFAWASDTSVDDSSFGFTVFPEGVDWEKKSVNTTYRPIPVRGGD